MSAVLPTCSCLCGLVVLPRPLHIYICAIFHRPLPSLLSDDRSWRGTSFLEPGPLVTGRCECSPALSLLPLAGLVLLPVEVYVQVVGCLRTTWSVLSQPPALSPFIFGARFPSACAYSVSRRPQDVLSLYEKFVFALW